MKTWPEDAGPPEINAVSSGEAPESPMGQSLASESLVRKAELVISYVLRGGVLFSAAITLLGVLLFYLRYGVSGGKTGGTAAFPHSLDAVGAGLAHGDPQAVIVLGLLVLLATPVIRVAVSIIAFGVERDWRYVIITSLVLLILLISFILGKGGV
jgi:uncharacterized membrane protein